MAWMPGSSTSKKKEAKSDKNSFHQAMKNVLVISQCFTVMPVQGITGPGTSSLRFRWCSLRVIYSLVGIVCVSLLATFWTGVLVQSGLKLNNFSGVVFYGTTLINMILFLKLAKDWPELGREIHHIEKSLQLRYGYCKDFARDVQLIYIVFLSAALLEHLLSMSRPVILAVHCSDRLFGWVDVYLSNFYGHIFKHVAYSTWFGLALLFTDNVATFAWNYIDLFIILVSMMLTQRFQQFNKRMRTLMNIVICVIALCFQRFRHLYLFLFKVVPMKTWRELREDFSTLASMVTTVDARINKLVLVSFWNNLYFVCLQLYYTIISTRTVEEAVYFYSSFGYLLVRFVSVCLCAAAVNDESKGSIPVLYSVPSESYCGEVARFIDHATGEEIALSALNFFSLTRTLLLTVAGTIVTYEMIMVQLNTATVVMTANQTTAENQTFNPFCPDQLL